MSALTKIESGSFAEACYNMNTLAELKEAIGHADKADMAIWCLDEAQYREQIELAIAALEEKAAE